MNQAPLLDEVAGYYADRLAQHGSTPQGVDWNGEEGQRLRFAQLLQVVAPDGEGELLDLGCGYGALLDTLRPRFQKLRYLGLDVSPPMVAAARERHGADPLARFELGARPAQPVDYAVASGIFNVRLSRSEDEWRAYVLDTLDTMHASTRRGFAFNCLTSYSDADRMRADLHYADPCALFHHCKTRYSRQVALLHDYGLYEFTVIVRKP
ncbi:MAG: class I SAM-dependent methyltransferase [Hydrogenophaga sp.]|uniref:methyltransferase n=1 Tax=Hydrogenophaga sp. TaxID=1904254 RepID=UPI001DDB332D|nr:class I SAM-dependent methyltransferase [Hydrogenophaga sp.]MBX3611690.1 class I SAM-dependent methyltransferase [Hydrogenophaga sp.]